MQFDWLCDLKQGLTTGGLCTDSIVNLNSDIGITKQDDSPPNLWTTVDPIRFTEDGA